MAFDTSAASAAQEELAAAAADKQRAEWISIGKTVGLGVLLLLALLIGLKRSRRRGGPAVQEIEVYRVPTAPAPVDAVLESTERRPALAARPVDQAAEHRAQARESIGVLARERPEDMARLLRGWIAEERS
jgi:flagellar M-ring protein FliF